MSNKVSALGKAFGALFAVLILVVWLSRQERTREEELRLVYDHNPAEAANADFLRGNRAFYECWRYIGASKEKTDGEWRVAGATRISAALLLRFPERRRIERSWHIGLSEDTARFSREAENWAGAYNQRLALLLEKLERDRGLSAP